MGNLTADLMGEADGHIVKELEARLKMCLYKKTNYKI